MAKFIKLHESRRNTPVWINADTIEYMLQHDNSTELVTITHHTKYMVAEAVEDILRMVDDQEVCVMEETMIDIQGGFNND